ncbi:MAG: DMT family transporter [Burkholderiaceae bacterium]
MTDPAPAPAQAPAPSARFNAPSSAALTRQQLALLVVLTLVWGLNWPVMKLGVADMPPLTFRAISIWLGIPVLAAGLWWLKVPFRLPRAHWPALLWLALFNMFIWHALIIVAVKSLSSGRAAILGYTMPIFSAILGALLFGAVLRARNWLGVGAASVGVVLLLWHEFTRLAGAPLAVALALLSALSWALGTQLLRRSTIPVPTLTLAFWMTALTAPVLTLLGWLLERQQWVITSPQWIVPSANAWAAIGYNAVMVFGFAHAAWFSLARSLPPAASTLSVMLIPVVGLLAGAAGLGEVLHWQDWAAVALMVVAIGSVLWPQKMASPAPEKMRV